MRFQHSLIFYFFTPTAPEETRTPEGAPAARISDSDSYGSSTTTSGERLRSLSEPIDPATGKSKLERWGKHLKMICLSSKLYFLCIDVAFEDTQVIIACSY